MNKTTVTMQVAGLFSGIGGLELPFHKRGTRAALLCDVWEPSQKVLKDRFCGVPIHGDVSTLESLPADVQVVTAGFPCTDLSQAGRTAGIKGAESGLVSHVFRLLRDQEIEWLVLENVRNMLVLDKGAAMKFLVDRLEELGFRWAYRLVDSRFAGVPQRRHRILLVATRHHDPRQVLFADDAGEPDGSKLRTDAFGFYWTEGLTGLGWAQDAIPPLKGGSKVGIPSPPAVWVPGATPGNKIVIPSVEDAEALQGFERGWTAAADQGRRNGPRWKLVGNAVTVGVADWLVGRLHEPGTVMLPAKPITVPRWPTAAHGHAGGVWSVDASAWPRQSEYQRLLDVLAPGDLRPLSHRAASGFLSRTDRSKLRFNEDFILDLKEHVELTGAS
jgi:DNA (cytosine-5)-methyltransferase 1